MKYHGYSMNLKNNEKVDCSKCNFKDIWFSIIVKCGKYIAEKNIQNNNYYISIIIYDLGIEIVI